MAAKKKAEKAEKATPRTSKTTDSGKSAKSAKSAKKAGGGAAQDRKDLAAKMRGIDFCAMTTRTRGKGLRTRPMSNNGEVDFDGDAWFFSWRDTQKVRDIAKNPAVSLAYEGQTKKGPVWIVVYGEGEVVDDDALKKKHWTQGLEKWFDSGPENPHIALIRVSASRAAWWSFEGEGEVAF